MKNTNREQSKKLVDLGIDINSADLCWTNHLFGGLLSSLRLEGSSPKEYKSLLDRFSVKGYTIEPAWSLEKLLDLISDKDYKIINTTGLNEEVTISYMFRNTTKVVHGNDLLEVTYKLICRLLENNLL